MQCCPLLPEQTLHLSDYIINLPHFPLQYRNPKTFLRTINQAKLKVRKLTKDFNDFIEIETIYLYDNAC